MFSDDSARPELLAPAGSLESFRAAVSMGADAVYMAGKSFGARAYADNFDADQLRECVCYAHLRGVKVYITVNTLVGDRELPALREYLKFLDDIGADGIIVQDLSVLRLAEELELRPALHASTQLFVHNLRGAVCARELGFVRAVAARELTGADIADIAAKSGIDIEMFVHGAMCMSYSGQCLMSSALGGRSGNRGKCAQPCRRAYFAHGSEKHYLSLKDMSLIEHIDEILSSGAASLKIEGRMKGAAYVGGIVKIYRACLDEKRRPSPEERAVINSLFDRGGYSDGYFMNRRGRSMFAFDKPDNPYLSNDSGIIGQILEEAAAAESSFKIDVSAHIRIAAGEKVRLRVCAGELVSEAESSTAAEAAEKAPISSDRIKKQISKTGDSVFRLVECTVDMHGSCYVPVKALNELRRTALSGLKQKIHERFRVPRSKHTLPVYRGKRLEALQGLTAVVKNRAQYRAVLRAERESGMKFRLIGVPIHELINDTAGYQDEAQRIVIEPNAVIRPDEYSEYERQLSTLRDMGFDKLRIHNISELGRSGQFYLLASFRLNITNSLAAGVFEDNFGVSAVGVSAELSVPQIRDIAESCTVPVEASVYGYRALMTTENCIMNNMGDCPCGSRHGVLTDRLGKKFPIIRDGNSCRSILLNSCPTYMGDKLEELKDNGVGLMSLDFTIETHEDTLKICKAYLLGKSLELGEFTRFHYYKGILKK